MSLPEAVVKAADRRADQEARSRSWIVAEAVAAYTGLAGSPSAESAAAESAAAGHSCRRTAPPGPVTPAPSTPPSHGIGTARARQLDADLELTPERRVLEAELTARLASLHEERGSRSFVMSFNRYEDYLRWKDREAAGLA